MPPRPVRVPRSRGWCYTAFNPADLTSPGYLPAALYEVMQWERAPTTGNIHGQGYGYFKNARTADQVSYRSV